jgi:hypothetical protein
MKKAIILSLMLALVLTMTGCSAKGQTAAKALSMDDAKAKITDYINNQLLAGAPYKATVNSISEVDGLYKMSINVNNQNIDTYMTKDATIFFPQAIDTTKNVAAPAASSTASNQSTPSTQTVNTKSAKPTVELFVMSQCPYGTQMEKGILPVVATLGKKINFTVKFCDYSMHNGTAPTELNEEMSQYCIQKNEPQNYQAYLNCYLASAGDPAGAAACVKSTKINSARLASCIATTDKTYSVIAGFNDKSTWDKDQSGNPAFPQFNVYKADNTKYGVQGSPTLVINGETITSDRDSASLLATICSAFTTQPAECKATLSSAEPSAGFGTGTASGSNSGATCNTPTQQ